MASLPKIDLHLNTSGFVPLDCRVLVLPDPISEKIGSVFVPQQHQEREQMAQVKATLVGVGVNAWSEARQNPEFEAPEPGGRVLIAKYGGIVIEGQDGAKYRILNDVDVTCVIAEDIERQRANTLAAIAAVRSEG